MKKTLAKETAWDRALQTLLLPLRDSHLSPRRWPAVPLPRRVEWTWRHRLGALGIGGGSGTDALRELRDAHRGQRCFIMGNGPSLNRCDLTLLRDEFTFGVNSIFLNRDTMGFSPTYYVVEDPLVLEDRHGQINAYRGPRRKFFGNYARRFIKPADDVTFLNLRLRYDEYRGFPWFSRNAVRQVWAGGTVSYVCLQLAWHMGFSEVYLVGFDHHYEIPADAKVSGNQILSTSADPNHFHPDYFGKGYRWHNPRVDRMEDAYRRARQVFEGAGRRVCNATVGGALEVFPRVDYATLFASGARRAA